MENYEYMMLKKFTLNLSQQKGIGPRTFRQLNEYYGDVNGIYKNIANLQIKDLAVLSSDELTNILYEKDIDYVCVWEDTYPVNLSNIDDPPIVLFYKGNYNKDSIDNSLSIVGTRNISSYGKKHTLAFSNEISNRGYSVISGMALGVDREAHIACLDSKGYTIAVLASSVDLATPQSNSDLYRRILNQGGLILSETFPGTKMSPGLFPNRNRIVAGLSMGTLVIEAGEKSGALITASLALGYNREVFAIPGSLESQVSKGTNKLIKESRAKLVQNVDDILIEFGHLPSVVSKVRPVDMNLSFQEEEVYSTILAEPKFPEEISIKINKNIQDVLSLCSLLELKGLISKDDSNKYYII